MGLGVDIVQPLRLLGDPGGILAADIVGGAVGGNIRRRGGCCRGGGLGLAVDRFDPLFEGGDLGAGALQLGAETTARIADTRMHF